MTPVEIATELVHYAADKKGASCSPPKAILPQYLEEPSLLELIRVFVECVGWGDFFNIEERNAEFFLALPVTTTRLAELQQTYPAIQKTNWVERDGHVQMAVPLDESISVETLKELIDEAYALIWAKLDESGRYMIERAANLPPERELLDELIQRHELQSQRDEILSLVREAVLLRAKAEEEDDIPIGASKLGGLPDLPEEIVWPTFELDGEQTPLAFLAQIDLAEVAKLSPGLVGLQTSGLLSLFSICGWIDPEEGIELWPVGMQDKPGWHAIYHAPAGSSLSRRECPGEIFVFNPAVLELIPILSLPNHREEPPCAALGWNEEQWEKYDGMDVDFRSIQWGAYLGRLDVFTSHNLLGGYAMFQQQYPEELIGVSKTMLIQIGSDESTMMLWGDGGELTFYVDEAALREGRFENIECIYQCG